METEARGPTPKKILGIFRPYKVGPGPVPSAMNGVTVDLMIPLTILGAHPRKSLWIWLYYNYTPED